MTSYKEIAERHKDVVAKWGKYVVIDDYYKVDLVIDHQSFTVLDRWDYEDSSSSMEHALWYQAMMCVALDRMITDEVAKELKELVA